MECYLIYKVNTEVFINNLILVWIKITNFMYLYIISWGVIHLIRSSVKTGKLISSQRYTINFKIWYWYTAVVLIRSLKCVSYLDRYYTCYHQLRPWLSDAISHYHLHTQKMSRTSIKRAGIFYLTPTALGMELELSTRLIKISLTFSIRTTPRERRARKWSLLHRDAFI